MYVVPCIPNVTVLNKTIVYSDIVLSLKDFGNNLRITTIFNVSESSLESCLKKVLESNPNVVFNIIQYSENNKKVYFYTDKDIIIKEYEERRISRYKPITSNAEILEEAKRVLDMKDNKDKDCISLYDIANFLKNMNYRYENMKGSYESSMKYYLNSKYYRPKFVIYDFDYDKNELRIGFGLFEHNLIRFSKKNDDLYITQSESYYAKEILAIIGDELSKLYDEFMKYRDYKKQYKYGFNAVNSNFLVDINSYGVSICVKKKSNRYLDEFSLCSHSYTNEYNYDCNSNNIIQAFKGKETEIFKRIFVKITDCPEWSQPFLSKIRQEQLEQLQKLEDAINYQEMKRERRLELIRKIFPFI